MRRASIRDLHIHTSELVREATEGSVIVIEKRGEPVAELRPLTISGRLTPETKEKIWKQMEKVWAAQTPSSSDSTQILEDDRDR